MRWTVIGENSNSILKLTIKMNNCFAVTRISYCMCIFLVAQINVEQSRDVSLTRNGVRFIIKFLVQTLMENLHKLT